ncbi:hypothetical protein GCM10022224_047910 [Nonomuraea antimicrobica]|uniref:Uncharacterized protein n=1 Tax=Nonomuraea antimicrobica TaxID=561173 RepID=A0ABP7C355_9ACTN
MRRRTHTGNDGYARETANAHEMANGHGKRRTHTGRRTHAGNGRYANGKRRTYAEDPGHTGETVRPMRETKVRVPETCP